MPCAAPLRRSLWVEHPISTTQPPDNVLSIAAARSTMKPLPEWDALPKFIIADDGDDRDFIVHLHYPRFVIEYHGTKGEPLFIDDEGEFTQSELTARRKPEITLSRLVDEAREFFIEQTERGHERLL
jgi:hypothetical protein